MNAIQKRLEYLRGELRAERISYGELHELQSLAPHIEPGDVELLEAAGVPEGEEPEPLSECDDCEWKGIPDIKFPEIPDLWMRLNPGGTIPSGECPKCHTLCYPVKEEKKP